MGLKELICDNIGTALSMGSNLAVGPLTALLAPEIGPAAPFVAKAIVWIAEHTIGGLASWVCDSPQGQKTLKGAEEHVQALSSSGIGAQVSRIEQSQKALAEHGKDMAPLKVRVPGPSPGAQVLAESVTSGVPPIPTFPIVSGKTPTGFTPQPIQHPRIGIEFWPRQDDPRAKRYYHWDRYQSTWNGQPNATFPKVGW